MIGNILDAPTKVIGDFLESHPTLLKAVLLVDHLFRAAAMVGFMFIPGVPMPAKWTFCAVGSLFYRLTVEKNCAYKFALSAFFGATAFMALFPTIQKLIHHTAFATMGSGVLSCLSFVPLILYGAYITYSTHIEVESHLQRDSCCKHQTRSHASSGIQ